MNTTIRISFLTISLLAITPVSTVHSAEQIYLLESSVLRIVDGSFFNADSIELIRALQRKLLAMLVGTTVDGQRVGIYEYEGKKYSVKDLTIIEHQSQKLTTNQQQNLVRCLNQIKDDFIVISNEFRSAAQGAKPAMAKLIEESCTKRQRTDSLLIILAKTPEDQENDMFKKLVTSIRQFEQVCIDLLNFLNDLMHSCPKAQIQFKQRIEKWNKIKEHLKVLEHDIAIHNSSFLHYIKVHHLDKLALTDISPKKLQMLFQEFLKEQSSDTHKG